MKPTGSTARITSRFLYLKEMDRPGISGKVFTLELKEAWFAICADPYTIISEPVQQGDGTWMYKIKKI